MNDLNKDILLSGLFVTGLFGFVSGAYVISSALLATVTVVNSLCGDFQTAKNVA